MEPIYKMDQIKRAAEVCNYSRHRTAIMYNLETGDIWTDELVGESTVYYPQKEIVMLEGNPEKLRYKKTRSVEDIKEMIDLTVYLAEKNML